MRKLITYVCAFVFVLALEIGVGVGVVHAAAPFQEGTPVVPPEIVLPGLATFAAFIVSAAGARWLSDKLRTVEWFNALGGNAKLALVVIACAAVGILVNEGRAMLATMPAMVAKIDASLSLVLPLWSWAVSQYRHGTVVSANRGADLSQVAMPVAMPPAPGWPTHGGG